jgi:glycosyltransferase involved in cell wall biosynthesis
MNIDVLSKIRDEIEALRADVQSLDLAVATLGSGLARALEALQLIYDEEPSNRRRLHELRKSVEYDRAYSEAEPLVSVVIPTYDRHETLASRSIPSALGQSYQNIEVIVVGEDATPEVADVVRRFGDKRLQFRNLNRRGPYPRETFSSWLASGTVPFNEAVHAAHGRWIAPLDDDDAFRPYHVETLLKAARAERWEAAMGLQDIHEADGHAVYTIGEFPPRLSQFNLQATLYHAGLRFMEMELATTVFEEPNDWNLCRRWLRCGVRMGLVRSTTVDIYPSGRWDGTDRNRPSPKASDAT